MPQSSGTNHNLITPPRPLPILPTADIYPPLLSDHGPSENEEKVKVKEQGEDKDGKEDADKIRENGFERYKIGREDYGKCPLCRRKWQNPAILESGWVVCWRCGWDAIQGDGDTELGGDSVGDVDGKGDGGGGGGKEGTNQRKGRCPITGVEVSRTDLRRVLL